MEVSEVCVSTFFENTIFEDNLDKTLNDACDKVETYMVFEDSNEEDLYEAAEKIQDDCITIDDSDDENLFNLCEVVERNTNQSGGSLKRTIETESRSTKKARFEEPSSSSAGSSNADHDVTNDQARFEEPPSSSVESSNVGHDVTNDQVKCSLCQVLVKRKYFANHLKSNLHKNKVLKSHNSLKNVSIIESAFGRRIVSYKIDSKNYNLNTYETSEIFLNSIKDELMKLIEESVQEHTVFKVNFELHADFVQQTKNIDSNFSFQTCNYIIFNGDDLNIFFSSLSETLMNKISTFEKKDSGWSLKNIKSIDMNVHKFNPLRGTSHIKLPKDIRTKKAVINVKNADNMSFKWALLSALYPTKTHSDRVSSYSMHSNKLNFDGVSFPVKISDIAKVEKLNNISINVFGLEFNKIKKCNSVVGPLFLTKSRKTTHINLLLISNGTNNHYCYIKNLSRLVSKQISNQQHAIYICDGCLLKFPTQERLINHQQHDCAQCAHVTTELPIWTVYGYKIK